MALAHSPKLVTSGLVLAIDSINKKSYDLKENIIAKSTFNTAEGYYSTGQAAVVTSDGGAAVVTTDAHLAPDGTTDATSIVWNSDVSGYRIGRYLGGYTVDSGDQYNFSMHVKRIGSDPNMNLYAATTAVWDFSMITLNWADGTVVRGGDADSVQVEILEDSWYRIGVTATAKASGDPDFRWDPTTSDSGEGFYVWGLQFEKNDKMTAFNPTSGTNKTRSTSLIDISKNTNNLTINGSTHSDPKAGPTFSDDGTISFREHTYFSGTANDFMGMANLEGATYEFAINLDWGTRTGYKTIFGFQETWNNIATLVLNTSTDELEFDLRKDGTQNRNIFQQDMTSYANQTIMISYTFDGSGATGLHKLYVNGELINEDTASLNRFPSFTGASGGFAIGENLWSSRLLENGDFYYARVYNRTLSPSEILQNYNSYKGRFGL